MSLGLLKRRDFLSNFKRKKVAAAAFTFLMALSSISGATIANPDLDNGNNQDLEEPITLNNQENAEYSPMTLNFTYLNFHNMVEKFNPGLDHLSRDRIYESAKKASIKHEVPLELILAVIGCESEFKPRLQGKLDDMGLMQVRFKYSSSWAKAMGIAPPANLQKLTDIDYNIDMGTFILSYLLKTFENDIHKSLTAYNAGEFYVKKKIANNQPLPDDYIKRVDFFYQQITNAALW